MNVHSAVKNATKALIFKKTTKKFSFFNIYTKTLRLWQEKTFDLFLPSIIYKR